MNRHFIISLFFLLGSAMLSAQVKLLPIFSDNMVLQQKVKAPIWGETSPNKVVEVTTSWNKRKYTARADEKGKWSVKVETPSAGGPYTVIISDGTPVTLKNVLIGEVWICSGQSNMEMQVEGWGKITNYEQEIAEAQKYPNIRFLQVKKAINTVPVTDMSATNDGWQVCSSKTLGDFSAAGYFFGRDLNKYRNVPIGLIDTTWGGTIIETWMSAEALQTMPGLKEEVEEIKHLPEMPRNTSSNPNTPTYLFNAMVNPLVPYAIKGVIWYQGEGNTGQAYQYRELLPLMIADWRKQWGTDFPFYIVQLANFMAQQTKPEESAWAELREAQTRTLHLDHTGMAVTIDIGDASDIHPKNKQEVGRRLALAARAQTYKEKIAYSGPMYQSYKIEGNKIRISFNHIAAGLKAKGNDTLKGFAVAGVDHKFYWANAVIEGNTVVVSCPEVEFPIAVRYAWGDNPVCNLYNSAGLPASPFRTDDWRNTTSE